MSTDNLIKVTLEDTIKRHHGLSRNAIAVEGKIRPATLSELVNGKSKAVSFETLTRIIRAMDTLTGERHTIEDIIRVER